jgi:hypothetical protein
MTEERKKFTYSLSAGEMDQMNHFIRKDLLDRSRNPVLREWIEKTKRCVQPGWTPDLDIRYNTDQGCFYVYVEKAPEPKTPTCLACGGQLVCEACGEVFTDA